MKLFLTIIILITTLSSLYGADECSSSDFLADINSSNPSYSQSSSLQNKNDINTFYVNVTEAGTLTIQPSTSDIFFIYNENGCSSSGSAFNTARTYTFASPTDFNLIVYTNINQGANYTLNMTFLSSGNNAPTANNKSYSIDTNSTNSISGNIITDQTSDTDSDGDTLTIGSFTSPSNGTLSVIANGGDGSFTYTPDANFTGVDSFEYTLDDGNGGSDSATVSIIVTSSSSSITTPTYDDEYSCGIFPSVLASYKSISLQQNDVYNACHVSIKDFDLQENSPHEVTCWDDMPDNNPQKCSCTPGPDTICSSNNTCQILPEPTNRYSHDFIDTTISGTVTHNGDIEFNDMYYPGYEIGKQGNNGTSHFNPQHTYDNSSRKVQIFGDVSFTDVGQEMTFEEGDYYFNSLSMDNIPDLNIMGDVRFFVKNDFTYSGNSMDTFNNGSLFIYIGGDLSFSSDGGGHGFLDMFVYVIGDANIAANANAASLFGGITAEGSIDISGQNMNFIYNEAGAEAMGYGECKLCYALTDGGSFINESDISSFNFNDPRDMAFVNQGKVTLSNVTITQTEDSDGYLSVDSNDYLVIDNAANDQSKFITTSCPDGSSGGFCDDNISVNAQVGMYAPGNINNYFALRTTGMSSTMSGVEEFQVFSTFDDGDKHYDVELDYCNVGGYISEPVLGSFDAYDNTLIDKNITTKVANRSFELRIVSYDDSENVAVLGDINAQYRLYDYNTSTALTSWSDFNTSTSNIVDSFIVTTAHMDVRVQFQFCQSDSNGTLQPFSSCLAGNPGVDYNVSTSRDNFAIRPDRFILNPQTGSDVELLTSAQNYDLSLIAAQNNVATPTIEYTILSAQDVLTENYNILNPDGSDGTATLNGVLNLVNTSNYNIIDGTSRLGSETTSDGTALDVVGINFTDVGETTINIRDITWASVDINHDTTPLDCSEDGAYICGDINATFIPASFQISGLNIENINGPGTNFTYLDSNKTNDMSARVAFNIEARNFLGGTTQNFSQGVWENPVNIDLNVTTSNTPPLVKETINTNSNLGFIDGNLSIPWNETNTTKKIRFNFQRAVNVVKNPFIVPGADVDLNASSIYTSSSGNTANVTGTSAADIGTNQATFIYGRTNAPRKVFTGSSGNAYIYFESYCFGTDSYGETCQKSILPNNTTLVSTDDPRWFVNTEHNATTYGTVGSITQKNTASPKVTNSAITPGAPTQATLNYDGSSGYPYKATMENNASGWLIYNPYDPNDINNEFEVEFVSSSSDWAGVDDAESTTESNASTKTNRRIMW